MKTARASTLRARVAFVALGTAGALGITASGVELKWDTDTDTEQTASPATGVGSGHSIVGLFGIAVTGLD